MGKRITIRQNAFDTDDDRQDLLQGESESAGMDGMQTWINVFDVARLFVRRTSFIIGMPIVVMILTAVVVLLLPNEYESRTTILPVGNQDKMAELKDLANLGGFGASEENSSVLYPNILQSHLIKDAILSSEYTFADGEETITITLPDYLEESNPDDLRLALGNITSVSQDKKTGVITLGVRTEYPGLSQKIAAQYLAELENYNLHKRRSRAGENSVYLARQLEIKKEELSRAEQALEDFQMANRNWASTTDPEILMGFGRLKRETEICTQAYLFLSREHESAKLDALKDVPIVQVLDSPGLPTKKVAPKRTMTVLIAGVVAFLIAIGLVMLTAVIGRIKNGRERESYVAFRSDLSETFPRINQILVKMERRETVLSE